MDVQVLCKLIDENKEELFSLLGSLIKINSENYGTGGNEKELAELIHKMAFELGLKSDIYSPVDLEGFKNHLRFIHKLDLPYDVLQDVCYRNSERVLGIPPSTSARKHNTRP